MQGQITFGYFHVLPALDLAPFIAADYGIGGRSSVDGEMVGGTGNVTVGVQATWRTVWHLEVRATDFPHGTTVNLEGVAFTAPAPLIANTTITPFTVGSPDDGATGLTHFPEETLTNVTPSRTPTADVPGLTQAILTNPNKLLQDAIAGQDIIGTTVLIIASDPTLMPPPGGPVPAHATAGGGIANIGFLSGGVPTGFNANVLATTAIFWIETVKNADGTTFLQLQYTQRVLLVFNGLVWPHISVATLT